MSVSQNWSGTRCIETVCSLLADLPGITVLGSDLIDGQAQFRVFADGPTAIHTLNYLSLSANVALSPTIRTSEWISSAHSAAEMVLVASMAARGEIEHGELQLLAIHLVWYLHKSGLIATPHANRLLQDWHAATVGV